MVFQDRLVVVEDGQGRAGLDVEVVGGSCVGLKLNRGFVGAPRRFCLRPSTHHEYRA